MKDERKPSSAASLPPPAGKKFVIKSADMNDDMQKEAIDIATDAYEKHSVEKDVAEYIKKEFDKKHGPTWHCIVGKNFALRDLHYGHNSATACIANRIEIGLDRSPFMVPM